LISVSTARSSLPKLPRARIAAMRTFWLMSVIGRARPALVLLTAPSSTATVDGSLARPRASAAAMASSTERLSPSWNSLTASLSTGIASVQ
jgi:hypothetical protein